METTKPEGSSTEGTGSIKQAAGDLLDEAGSQVSGTTRELGDKAQQLYTDFAGIVRDATVERPFAALAIAAGAGFVLGLLSSANRPRTNDGGRGSKHRNWRA